MKVTLYRAIPKRVRTGLLGFVPSKRRLWLARRVVSLPVGRPTYDTVGRRLVRDGGQLFPASVMGCTTPLQVRQNNLKRVEQVLDRAAIPYFRVRPTGDMKTVVAVPIGRQAETVALLRKALPDFAIRWVSIDSTPTRQTGGPNAILQVFRPVTAEQDTLVLGGRHACEVEFWSAQGDRLVAPRPNAVSDLVAADYQPVRAPERAFGNFHSPQEAFREHQTHPEFANLGVDIVDFPIDAVYTWVDGADPDWLARKNRTLAAQSGCELNESAATESRYASRDELRFSLRSLVCFAPWIRHIYLVTDDQLPAWLNSSHPMITVVPHREIFGDTGSLPTFNSHAIESRLHRIPGLAEHFLYLNDDMFFGRPLLPTAFFHANGIAKYFTSPAQVDAGAVAVTDAPATAAGKNNRAIIKERFGRTITQKMKHVPYPLLRSVLERLEEHLPEQFAATAAHPFRHPQDLSVPSSLHHYWSFLSGQSVPGGIGYRYADLGDPTVPALLRSMLVERFADAFCINDTDAADVPVDEQLKLMAQFLPAYFPYRSPFELSEEVAVVRAQRSASQLMDSADACVAS